MFTSFLLGQMLDKRPAHKWILKCALISLPDLEEKGLSVQLTTDFMPRSGVGVPGTLCVALTSPAGCSAGLVARAGLPTVIFPYGSILNAPTPALPAG